MEVGALIYLVLALASAASILAKRPWTILLARRTTPRELWVTPLFLETNCVITALWALAFGIAGVAASRAGSPWVHLGVGAVLLVLGLGSQKLAMWYVGFRTRSRRA